MDPLVIGLVLAAAVMHAVWNTVLKVGDDRLMTMAVVIGVSGLPALALVFWGPPPAPASWPFIGLSVAIHCAYFFFLIQAYRVGDLSHAYPLARGSAPLTVAAGGALFAGETLHPLELLGVVLVSAGIISLLLTGGYGLRGGSRTLFYPLATGAMIAAYTVGRWPRRSPLGQPGELHRLVVRALRHPHWRLRASSAEGRVARLPARQLEAEHRRRPAGVRRLCAGDLGAEPGRHGARVGAARDQRGDRRADRHAPAGRAVRGAPGAFGVDRGRRRHSAAPGCVGGGAKAGRFRVPFNLATGNSRQRAAHRALGGDPYRAVLALEMLSDDAPRRLRDDAAQAHGG